MIDPALQQLTEEPLGSPALQQMADAAFRRQHLEGKRSPPEVAEMAKRVSKIFLPAGRRQPKDDRGAREEFAARQIDIEDAVAAAGGSRGS
jgi:hypothetical protein